MNSFLFFLFSVGHTSKRVDPTWNYKTHTQWVHKYQLLASDKPQTGRISWTEGTFYTEKQNKSSTTLCVPRERGFLWVLVKNLSVKLWNQTKGQFLSRSISLWQSRACSATSCFQAWCLKINTRDFFMLSLRTCRRAHHFLCTRRGAHWGGADRYQSFYLDDLLS